MKLKTLQYLMGHSDIDVMLNIYTHLGLEDATGAVDGRFGECEERPGKEQREAPSFIENTPGDLMKEGILCALPCSVC